MSTDDGDTLNYHRKASSKSIVTISKFSAKQFNLLNILVSAQLAPTHSVC